MARIPPCHGYVRRVAEVLELHPKLLRFDIFLWVRYSILERV